MKVQQPPIGTLATDQDGLRWRKSRRLSAWAWRNAQTRLVVMNLCGCAGAEHLEALGFEQVDVFTVGKASSYDEALRLVSGRGMARVRKIGRRDDYEGGWIWRSRAQAAAFLADTDNGCDGYAVYGVELPRGWALDVSRLPAADGVHRLLVDSPLRALDGPQAPE